MALIITWEINSYVQMAAASSSCHFISCWCINTFGADWHMYMSFIQMCQARH